MSKKNTNTNTATKLESIFSTYENLSIRKLSKVTEINYTVLLKCARKPVEGEIYNPDAINFAELAKKIDAKNINLDEIDWEALNVDASTATLSKNADDFEVGALVYLRENNETPYRIIYKTDTHIAMILEGTTEIRAMSISTFFYKGPSFTQRIAKEEEPSA